MTEAQEAEPDKCRVACIQMRCGVEIGPNIAAACAMIREAASQGAQLIATPEVTNIVDLRPGMARPKIVIEARDETLAALTGLAKEIGVWLLIGSLAIKLEDDDRLANRSYLIAPDGKIIARYDKAHMFDVDVDDGQSYRESRSYRAGQEAVLVETPLGQIGLTVCYDLRFGALYRMLAQGGAQIITCPAAFTRVTGKAHWHALLRARAIETGAYIIAPAQGGKHEDGRETYGHSLVVSPWGEIVAERNDDTPGVLLADIDLGEVEKARRRVPSLAHDQPLRLVTIKA